MKNWYREKTSSVVYRSLLKSFHLLPLSIQNFLIVLIKKIGLPNNRFYKDLKYKGRFAIKTHSGKFYMYAGGGTIENEIFWKGLYQSLEPETIVVWEQLSKLSNVIFDIGANTGVYGLLSKAINPESQVFCFEPSRNTYRELKRNIESNAFDIRALEMALSDRKGTCIFYDTVNAHQTSASLSPKKLKENPEFHGLINEYLVNTITLDEFVKENNLPSLDLVKIDVELHEPEVFAGMSTIIEKYRPIVIFEVLTPEVAERINLFFNNLPYTFYHMEMVKNSILLNKVMALEGRINFEWNYLVCPYEKIQLLTSLFKVNEK